MFGNVKRFFSSINKEIKLKEIQKEHSKIKELESKEIKLKEIQKEHSKIKELESKVKQLHLEILNSDTAKDFSDELKIIKVQENIIKNNIITLGKLIDDLELIDTSIRNILGHKDLFNPKGTSTKVFKEKYIMYDTRFQDIAYVINFEDYSLYSRNYFKDFKKILELEKQYAVGGKRTIKHKVIKKIKEKAVLKAQKIVDNVLLEMQQIAKFKEDFNTDYFKVTQNNINKINFRLNIFVRVLKNIEMNSKLNVNTKNKHLIFISSFYLLDLETLVKGLDLVTVDFIIAERNAQI